MTFRQFMFCAALGPFFIFFAVGGVCLFPLLLAIGWLLGEPKPWIGAWEILTVPPREMFREGYRGLRD